MKFIRKLFFGESVHDIEAQIEKNLLERHKYNPERILKIKEHFKFMRVWDLGC